MIMLAKFCTPGLVDICSASWLDSISHSFALPACARKPGANNGLFKSSGAGGAGGGFLEQAASAIAPARRIPIFLIALSPSFQLSRTRNRPAAGRFLLAIHDMGSGAGRACQRRPRAA